MTASRKSKVVVFFEAIWLPESNISGSHRIKAVWLWTFRYTLSKSDRQSHPEHTTMDTRKLIIETLDTINSVSTGLLEVSEATDVQISADSSSKARDLLLHLDQLTEELERLSFRLLQHATSKADVTPETDR